MTARLIQEATVIRAAGNPPKQIQEFIGRVSSGTDEVSIAKMVSPPGWKEPGQRPEFNEYSVVLKGTLEVVLRTKRIVVKAGQAIAVPAGERVQYQTPEGAEYIAVCVPAFSPATVNRDREC